MIDSTNDSFGHAFVSLLLQRTCLPVIGGAVRQFQVVRIMYFRVANDGTGQNSLI